ncbi:MAG TPA: hypothetical protein VFR46_13060 [Actinomycetes bacterium]|nr:hypothetical protein [Actinomycetes bacterium]
MPPRDAAVVSAMDRARDLSMRARWVLVAWLTVAAPMTVVFTLVFTTGRWAGLTGAADGGFLPWG